MTDSAAPIPAGAPQAPRNVLGEKTAKSRMPRWLSLTILGLVAAAVLVVAYLIASVTVPLLWANSIKDQVGGQLGNTIPLGMFYGFTFTFIPVLVMWQAHHKKMNMLVRVCLVALGLLLTVPNLLTLAVLYGTTGTAADARAIWSNDANWFGTWSQLFMVIGVLSGIVVIILGRIWLSRGKKIRQIKADQKLVLDNEQAQARTAKEEERAAEKAAKTAARANRRHHSGTASSDSGAAASTPPETPQA
ncbi:hypothetical protein ACX80E_04890 [Arthrobacter sp. TMN-49]